MVLTRKRNRKYKVNLNETLQFPLSFFALIRKSDKIYKVNLSFSVPIMKRNRKYKGFFVAVLYLFIYLFLISTIFYASLH